MPLRHPTALRRRTVEACRSLLSAARGLVVAVVVTAVALLGAAPAAAHTDVVFTLPAADETVVDPVDTITVAFADPVTLVGAGFEVFTPQEQIVQPVVVTDDDTEFVLQLDPPLAGGVVGVRYEVVAADGHIIDGSFTFTVTAPASAPTSTPATSAPTTTAPVVAATSDPLPATEVGAATTGAPITTEGVPTSETAVIATAPTTVIDDTGSGGGSAGLLVGVVIAAALAVGAVAILRVRMRRSA